MKAKTASTRISGLARTAGAESWLRWLAGARRVPARGWPPRSVLRSGYLLRACRSVKETHQIAYVGGLQGRPGYAQFLSPINHAGAMPPERGGEGNGGESFGARLKRGPNLCAFRHVAMASCAAALGKDALANQGRASGLEVPQAGKKRQQIRHLVALKNGRRNPVLAALTEHRRRMVPQNTGKLPRG